MRNELTTVSVWLSITALATAQARATPAELVDQLAVADQRANAREQLLALGKQAVPALADRVSDLNLQLRTDVLALLVELGPDAGAAVPQLVAAVERSSTDPTPTLLALAELAPFRQPGIEVDVNAMTLAMRGRNRRDLFRPGASVTSFAERLRRRLECPQAPDLETLLTMVKGYNAYRVELAVEHLGQRGAAAVGALPHLQRLLEQPEPRILLTDRTVPMHRKAARAVIAIAPASKQADLARTVLAGRVPVPAAAPAVPERARTRIDELIAELDDFENRDAAAANLVALGTLAAPAVAATLTTDREAASHEAALGILRDLGPRAASTVPQLVDALVSLSTSHTVSVLGALQATAPWCTDVVPELDGSFSIERLNLFGHRIPGNVDAKFLTSLRAAQAQFRATMAVDPTCSLDELGTLLDSRVVATREAALAVVRERGPECRPLLPVIANMLTEQQPRGTLVQWQDAQPGAFRNVDRSATVQHLAAKAIVAIAASDDPLIAAARDVLARSEPK